MGIPYSREINAAFDQVTPLVGAGFEVLKTTKNIAILLAVIQVLTALLLALILIALLALTFTLNPDLEKERVELVTPFMRWLSSWVYQYGTLVSWVLRVFLVLALAGLGAFFWQGSLSGYVLPRSPPPESSDEDKEKEKEEE